MLVGPVVVTTGVITPWQLSVPVKTGATTIGLQPSGPLTAVVEMTGGVISITLTFIEQLELQPLPAVSATESVNGLLQLDPVVILTVDPFADPTIDPFPEIVHKYDDIPTTAV